MGIKDLLPSLKSIQKPCNISVYSGQTVAIDGYCWLHQGAYSCSKELVYGKGISKLMQYCKNKLEMVIEAGVRPLLVFDGNQLNMKKGTEDERAKNREIARKKAEELQAMGQEQAAMRKYCEAVDITPEMAASFIEILKSQNVEFYVAPYEADAQLAFLYMKGKVSVVITEDSDLIPFGVKKCFFKMDRVGNGIEVDLDQIDEVTDFNFKNFKDDMLLTTCILSGCDYLESIKGIGFKKAFKLIHEYGDDLPSILKKIRREGKLIIPQDYEKNFELAMLTFKFQTVYCPEKRELVHLNDPETHTLGSLLVNYPDLNFLGEKIEKEIAVKICTGQIDPVTRQKFEIKRSFKQKEGPAKKTGKSQTKPSKNLHSFFKTNVKKQGTFTQGMVGVLRSQKYDNTLTTSSQNSGGSKEEETIIVNRKQGSEKTINFIKQKMKDRFKFKNSQPTLEIQEQNSILENTPIRNKIIGQQKRPLQDLRENGKKVKYVSQYFVDFDSEIPQKIAESTEFDFNLKINDEPEAVQYIDPKKQELFSKLEQQAYSDIHLSCQNIKSGVIQCEKKFQASYDNFMRALEGNLGQKRGSKEMVTTNLEFKKNNSKKKGNVTNLQNSKKNTKGVQVKMNA